MSALVRQLRHDTDLLKLRGGPFLLRVSSHWPTLDDLEHLTWASGTGMAAQVHDSSTGATVGAQFSIAAPSHPWESWKPYPDGRVAYASVASARATARIARVLPCPNQEAPHAIRQHSFAPESPLLDQPVAGIHQFESPVSQRSEYA